MRSSLKPQAPKKKKLLVGGAIQLEWRADCGENLLSAGRSSPTRGDARAHNILNSILIYIFIYLEISGIDPEITICKIAVLPVKLYPLWPDSGPWRDLKKNCVRNYTIGAPGVGGCEASGGATPHPTSGCWARATSSINDLNV